MSRRLVYYSRRRGTPTLTYSAPVSRVPRFGAALWWLFWCAVLGGGVWMLTHSR